MADDDIPPLQSENPVQHALHFAYDYPEVTVLWVGAAGILGVLVYAVVKASSSPSVYPTG